MATSALFAKITTKLNNIWRSSFTITQILFYLNAFLAIKHCTIHATAIYNYPKKNLATIQLSNAHLAY